MLKRLLMFGLALGVTTSLATADVIFQWNGSSEKVDLEVGVNTTIEVTMRTNPGLTSGIGLIALGFSGSDPEIAVKDWRWVDALSDDALYLAIDDLPDGIQTAYVLLECINLPLCQKIQDGQKYKIGDLDVQVNEVGSFFLDAGTGAEYVDADFGALEIKQGLRVKLNVVPEPASIGLLLLGALTLIRRR